MLIKIPNVLTKEHVREIRQKLDVAKWVAGSEGAGHQSNKVKNNLQLGLKDSLTYELGLEIIDALEHNPLFVSSALPLKVSPPLFNKYENGGQYGNHVDSAIRQIPNTPHRLRTDLSATLFLSEPEEYEGGELVIEDLYGTYPVKLNAGDLVLYESGSLHRVEPVTSGARVASFMWIQSMIRNTHQRMLLLDLDTTIQKLTNDGVVASDVTQLTGVYHNLLRMWSEV